MSRSDTIVRFDHTHYFFPPPRRKAYDNIEGRGIAGCMGKRKQKKKVMYSSHHSGEFESYNMVLYEPVMLVENFQYRTLVLIGGLLAVCLSVCWSVCLSVC